MEGMDGPPCVVLGIKIKPGHLEQHRLENFALNNTVDCLRAEAEKKTKEPSSSLELIYHGKLLKDNVTLQDCGVKSGETIHVVKKKVLAAPAPPPTYTDAELQQLNASLRTLGCTPNASGWTRAMQLLNDESTVSEIIEQAPSLGEDCVALSILHEVELIAALGANVQTMRRGADAHPELPTALRHLTRLVRSRSGTTPSNNVPTSGFAYSLEALSDDEYVEEENEEGGRNTITHEHLAAALQAATEAVFLPVGRGNTSGSGSTNNDNLLRLLQASDQNTVRTVAQQDVNTPTGSGSRRSVITTEMFNEAISEAINRSASRNPAGTPMEESTVASSSNSPVPSSERYATQLNYMHEMGLLDDTLNVRALLMCLGDVNAAINLVFSGAIADD